MTTAAHLRSAKPMPSSGDTSGRDGPDRRDLHAECTMADLLLRSIERGGDRNAFVSGGRSTTYREFGALVSRMTQLFRRRNVGPGVGVACLGANTVEAFLVNAACYVTGARVTNLHPLASLDDQAFMLRDCGASVLFFDPIPHGERAAMLAERVPGLTVLSLGPSSKVENAMDEVAALPSAPIISTASSDDPCWIMYTGGTTGTPKGVVHSQRTHVAMVMAELAEWEWPAETVFLIVTPISHGAGACIVAVLMRSGTVVLEPGFSPGRFLEAVQEHGVTSTFLVPTMIYKLLDHCAGQDPATPTLSLVIYGAAPVAPARMREAIARFGPIFMQLYGQSEAPMCVSVLRKRDHLVDEARLGSCGLPIFTSQVALLDDAGHAVERGDVGEICVRGPLVMEGYWNRPDETAQVFRYGWLHTGDLARQDEHGFLHIVGRSKDMIISGGFNVYPAEVETVLAAHPAVSAVAVIGIPDPTWGEAVTAVVVLRADHAASEIELASWVRDAKGAVHAPKRVIVIPEIPITPLGKPDKKELRSRLFPSERTN